MLQSCTEVPTLTSIPTNINCLSDIANRFIIAYVIGKGVFGVVIKVSVAQNENNTQVYAVKISKLDQDAITDVRISCKINSLYLETGVFLRTYGWLICKGLSSQWTNSYIEDYPQHIIGHKESLLYVFMDLADEEFENQRIKFSSSEIYVVYVSDVIK